LQEDWKTLDLLVNTQEQENAVIPNDLTIGRRLKSLKGAPLALDAWLRLVLSWVQHCLGCSIFVPLAMLPRVALCIIIGVLVACRGRIAMVRGRIHIDASKRLSTATAGTVVRMLWSRKGELKILFRHESCRRA
jgi:hypothetical protein